MNYRHAFHAGNFADVMKHVVLCRILAHLRVKETPFRAVDTHAGVGRYDLAGEEAGRTGEWRDGIGRLEDPFEPAVEALLQPYRDAVAATHLRHGPSAYPGSPAIILQALRPQDRAILVEKHPDDAALLAERVRATRNAKALQLDGWTALRSLIPPRERRGLVLIDPPYEEAGELGKAGARLLEALARWPTGIFALWYPIKDPQAVATFAAAVAGGLRRDALRIEILVDEPAGGARLAGSGLIVANPPWMLAAEAGSLMPALAGRLARGSYSAFRCEPLSSGAPVR